MRNRILVTWLINIKNYEDMYMYIFGIYFILII